MDDTMAQEAFAALGHAHRLAVFRLLVSRGPEGCCAGDLAAAAGLSPSSLSFHVAALERARLVRARREGRRVVYAIDVEGTRSLVAFLTEECCGGQPELCGYPDRRGVEAPARRPEQA